MVTSWSTRRTTARRSAGAAAAFLSVAARTQTSKVPSHPQTYVLTTALGFFDDTGGSGAGNSLGRSHQQARTARRSSHSSTCATGPTLLHAVTGRPCRCAAMPPRRFRMTVWISGRCCCPHGARRCRAPPRTEIILDHCLEDFSKQPTGCNEYGDECIGGCGAIVESNIAHRGPNFVRSSSLASSSQIWAVLQSRAAGDGLTRCLTRILDEPLQRHQHGASEPERPAQGLQALTVSST